MKMVFQQAVSKRICHRRDMPCIEFQEIVVIPILDEDILAINAAVVDVVDLTRV